MVERQEIIREIVINNFKSIYSIDLGLKRGVNVLVGANGSGKTNILEAIYFLRKALIDEYGKEPYLPHLEWWDPLNLLPHRREGVIQYSIKGIIYNVIEFEYKVSFTLSGDRVTIIPIQHEFVFNKEFIFRLKPGIVEIEINKKLWNKLLTLVRKKPAASGIIEESILTVSPRDLEALYRSLYEAFSTLPIKCGENTCSISISFPWHKSFINLRDLNRILVMSGRVFLKLDQESDRYIYIVYSIIPTIDKKILVIPSFIVEQLKKEHVNTIREKPPFTYPWSLIIDLIKGIVFIKHPDIGSIRKPRKIESYATLTSRAENLISVMYRLRRTDPGFMDRVAEALSKLFPGVQIDFDILPDGRISLIMYEDGEPYPSPCIPDGLIKLLTIITALELKPSLLLIDEIENSMHARMLEYVFDELNNAGFPVLIATHSPYFIDLTDLDRILVVEKTAREGTTVKRIEDPEKLKKKLHELGITFSEYFLS